MRRLQGYAPTAGLSTRTGSASRVATPSMAWERFPHAKSAATAAATNRSELETWLDTALTGWDRVPEPADRPAGGAASAVPSIGRRVVLYRQALALAAHLRGCADAIERIADTRQPALDPDRVEADRLGALNT
jgi:hypothetical protein